MLWKRSIFWGVVAFIFIGEAGAILLPFQTGAFVDGLGVGEGRAGLLGSVETASLSACMFVAAFGLRGRSPARIALIGSLIFSAGQIWTATGETYVTVLLARAVVGTGAGLCLAAAVTTLASKFEDPDAASGQSYFCNNLGQALLVTSVPLITAKLGLAPHFALFGVLAGIGAIFAFFSFLLPRQSSPEPITSTYSTLPPWGTLFLFMSAQVLLLTGIGATWSFLERIGLAIGVDSVTLGQLFAVTLLIGALGASLAGWLGTKIGRRIPLLGGALAAGMTCIAVSSVTSTQGYAIALFFLQFFLAFLLPYTIGTAAMLDRMGSVATIGYSLQVLSMGIGAGIGGFAVEAYGLGAIGWLGLTGCVLGGLLFLPVCRAIEIRQVELMRNTISSQD